MNYGGMKHTFRGNHGKIASQKNENFRLNWKGTESIPTDIMLKRSMAFGPGPDNYFPNEEELKNYHVWMKFDYQYDKKTYKYGDWNVQCMDSAYFGSTWSATTKVLPMINN